MAKNIVIIVVAVIVVIALLIGANYMVFLTEKAKVAEQCMLGNQTACQYWQAEKNVSNAEDSLKGAKEAYKKAREAYEASLTNQIEGE